MDPPVRHEQPLVSLKVMRLCRPQVALSMPLANERGHIADDFAASALQTPMLLPASFGSIYAGQVFSSYLAVINASNFVLNDVTIQAELQAGNSRRTLKNAAEGGAAPSTEALGVGATLGMVVRERLPDSGPHVLRVAVEHRHPRTGDPAVVRKVYKFTVKPPLQMSYRTVTLPDGRALVEAQLRNATGSDLSILDASFAAEKGWDARPVHSDTSSDAGQGGSPAAGSGRSSGPWAVLDASLGALARPYGAGHATLRPVLRKGELWQCAFALAPRAGGHGPAPGKPESLGHLHVSYAGPGGERGDMVGSAVTRHPRAHAKTRVVLHAPNSTPLGAVFPCRVEVRNEAAAPVRLRLEVRRHLLGDALSALGKCAFELGTVPAHGAASHTLQLVGSLAGLHAIYGVVAVDSAGNEAAPAHPPSVVVEPPPA